MSGTHVYYNGVLMRDCDTKLFDQNIGLDDSRNLLNSSWRIKVESTVFGLYYNDYPEDLYAHPSTVVTTNIDTDKTATDRMHTIQKRLSQPRKDFYYATHGGRREDRDESIYQILVAATGDDLGTESGPTFFQDERGDDLLIRYLDGYHESDGDTGKLVRGNVVDVNNGPIPLNVQITQVFGGRAFRVSFEIEIHRHLCLTQEDVETKPSPEVVDEDNIETNPFVISNTWSTEETCDEKFCRTKVVEGTLRVRDRRYWAHGFRSLCLPGLLPGYRRMSQRFASDPTNLVLKYRIEDKQAEAAPPWPCTDWVMSHVDSAKNEYGMITRQLSITLTGMPRATKANLIGMALRILDSRFAGAADGFTEAEDFKTMRPVPFTREGLVITHATDKPIVELMCDIRMHVAGAGGFEDAVEASTQPLSIAGYNPDTWPAARPFDADSPAGIFGCYLQSPCNQWHGMPEAQRLDLDYYETDNEHPTQPTVPSEYWEETDYEYYASPETIVDSKDVNRTDHVAYPYTHVEIDSRYTNSHGNMVLPYSVLRDVNAGSEELDPSYVSLAVIQVHAGVQHRIISVNCTRHGRPPELPEPVATLVDINGITQTLVGKSEIVIDVPQSSQDQSHRVFSVQSKFTYALARPMGNFETFMSANNPSLATVPLDNALSGFAIFGKGRIEFDRDAYGTPVEVPPTRPPGLDPGTDEPWASYS